MAQRYATIDDVRGIAPEFGAVGDPVPTVPDSVITTWLRVAQHWIGLGRWAQQASDGHALLAAHLVAIDPSGLGLGTGSLGGATVGPVNVSLSQGPPVDELLSTTTYGRAYLALRQLVASTGTAILSNTRVRLG